MRADGLETWRPSKRRRRSWWSTTMRDTPVSIRGWYSGQPVQILDAKDGDEGVRRAISEKPDIILMDLMMPRTNGFEASRRLRADPATSGIPVILLSARREPQTKREAFDAGIDHYVEKPFDLDEMDARIRSMLEKRKTYLKLEEEATVDEKTGLANYRVFYKKLREEWERSERYKLPLSIVMLDLDDFKRVNDSVGASGGRQGAARVRDARLGWRARHRPRGPLRRRGVRDDPPHTDRERAERVAERIRAAVADFTLPRAGSPASRHGVRRAPRRSRRGCGSPRRSSWSPPPTARCTPPRSAGKNRVVVHEP